MWMLLCEHDPDGLSSMNTAHGAPVLQVRPGWGPVQGGTSLNILHHKDFGSSHDILMGGRHLNCSAALPDAALAPTRTSTCCCTPRVAANVTSLPLTLVHRERRSHRPSGSRFVYYAEPHLLRLRPSHSRASGGVTVTVAATGWPSAQLLQGDQHTARCQFGAAGPVPAATVARSASSRRPVAETWLRCTAPDFADVQGGSTVQLRIAPNGQNFGTEGIDFYVHGTAPGSGAPLVLALVLAIACVAAAVVHALSGLQSALAASGWQDATPVHCSARRWHTRIRSGVRCGYSMYSAIEKTLVVQRYRIGPAGAECKTRLQTPLACIAEHDAEAEELGMPLHELDHAQLDEYTPGRGQGNDGSARNTRLGRTRS
jgi:hypothetical protein